MHLVGFIIRIYHDAHSSECQIHQIHSLHNSLTQVIVSFSVTTTATATKPCQQQEQQSQITACFQGCNMRYEQGSRKTTSITTLEMATLFSD